MESQNIVNSSKNDSTSRKPVRIWVDGCFDMMHYGHANALRQARAFGDILVVGVHSDQEIELNKGPTVMKEQERYAAVAACKWVDIMVPNAPYFTSLELMDKYGCDFCVHGDDVTTTADGTDCYQAVKDAGRYKECKRTMGVSTTDLVGRMLLLGKPHPTHVSQDMNQFASQSPVTNLVHYNQTTLNHFLSHSKNPKPGDKIGYADGGFDLFHIGHIAFLEAARAKCDFLLVGVHTDEDIRLIKGPGHPLMTLQERVLGVLSCKYVDQVVIGAPYSITRDFLLSNGVSIVFHGGTELAPDMDGQDAYREAKSSDVFSVITTPYRELSGDVIIQRILADRARYEERNRRKAEKAKLEQAMMLEQQQSTSL